MLQNLADRAPLDSISEGNVLLSRIWVVFVVLTYSLAVDIEQTLLALFMPWGGQHR